MRFKAVGGKVHKKVAKQPAPPQVPPGFGNFKFKMPPTFRPDLTDEARHVLSAIFQTVAEELMTTEWAETISDIGPQQLCETLVTLHEQGFLELAVDDQQGVGWRLRDPITVGVYTPPPLN